MTINLSIPPSLQPKPLIITAVIHAVLLLVFLLWRFSVPLPTPTLPEMGMEVNLGTSADGSGDDQPMDMEDPAPEISLASGSNASEAETQADVERSNEADAPAIAEPVKERPRKPKPVKVRVTRQRPARVVAPATATRSAQPARPRYVYPGSSGKGGNSASANVAGTGEGNTTGPGDRGVPGGTPGASNYTGSPGSGTGGISHSISGRSIVAFPPKDARFREGGRVVVHVTVDRQGAIVNQRILSSSNSELSPIALRKLKQVRFNKSLSAPEEQFGKITFIFKTGRQ